MDSIASFAKRMNYTLYTVPEYTFDDWFREHPPNVREHLRCKEHTNDKVVVVEAHYRRSKNEIADEDYKRNRW